MKVVLRAGLILALALGFVAADGWAAPSEVSVYKRLSKAMHAPVRTRSVVTQILDETNATFLTLWAYQEPEGVHDEMTITPDERRSKGWKAFYKNPESRIDYRKLAESCIKSVYTPYFTLEELAGLADFLERPKTREDVRIFAQTPLGRKYRAVMRRLSSETLNFIHREVDSVVQAVLGVESTALTQEVL